MCLVRCSALYDPGVTVLFFLVASAGAVVAFLTGTLANASTRPGATNVVTATHDLKNFRTLWVSIVVGTGLVILGMHLASYPVDSMRLSFSLIAQTIVRHFGPQAILTIMLLAIPLHIRLAHKVVVIPMAVFVLFEVLPTFTGFIGLSLNANSDLAPWLASRTSWLSTIAWIIAVVAIIVVFSRTDARRQTSVDVRNPMDPVSNKHSYKAAPRGAQVWTVSAEKSASGVDPPDAPPQLSRHSILTAFGSVAHQPCRIAHQLC